MVGRCFIIKRNITTITQAQKWAKENPLLAQKSMAVPAYNSKNDDDNCADRNERFSSLDQYLKWRKWDLNTSFATRNKNSQPLENDSENIYMQQMMINLVSHPLTYPLTLGSQLNRFLDNNNNNESKSSLSLRLCCIGARAEATLPLEYWKEMLIMAINMKENSSLNWEECIIDFIGPDVPKNLPSRTVSISQQSLLYNSDYQSKEGKQTSWTLRMNYHLDLFHNYIHKKNHNDNDNIDGFILFNPGIGHDYLKKIWKPTMENILELNKPILLTAHSDLDVERDREMLQNEYYNNNGDLNLDDPYEQNSFASRIQYQDPLHNTTTTTTSNSEPSLHHIHLVRPNHKLLFLSKKKQH